MGPGLSQFRPRLSVAAVASAACFGRQNHLDAIADVCHERFRRSAGPAAENIALTHIEHQPRPFF